MTQIDVAAALDVPQSTISRAERLVEGTPIRTYIRIAELLGVTLGDLFSDGRATEEQLLLDAYRGLSDDRKRGWRDMATALSADQPLPSGQKS